MTRRKWENIIERERQVVDELENKKLSMAGDSKNKSFGSDINN